MKNRGAAQMKEFNIPQSESLRASASPRERLLVWQSKTQQTILCADLAVEVGRKYES